MLRPDQLPFIPFFANSAKLRQTMADLSGRMGVLAEASGGTTSTVTPVLACLAFLEACIIPAMAAPPTYPTAAGSTAGTVVAAASDLPHDAPSILFAPVGSALRSELIRAVQQVRYSAAVSAGGKTTHASDLHAMIEVLGRDLSAYEPIPPAPIALRARSKAEPVTEAVEPTVEETPDAE